MNAYREQKIFIKRMKIDMITERLEINRITPDEECDDFKSGYRRKL